MDLSHKRGVCSHIQMLGQLYNYRSNNAYKFKKNLIKINLKILLNHQVVCLWADVQVFKKSKNAGFPSWLEEIFASLS